MKKIIINTENIGDERLEYLIQFLKDCEYEYEETSEKEEMLDNLGFYAVNDSDELPDILDKLLAYKGNGNMRATDAVEKLSLWQNVENWTYLDLMGAIQ